VHHISGVSLSGIIIIIIIIIISIVSRIALLREMSGSLFHLWVLGNFSGAVPRLISG
jgi:hypothetical protein